MKVREAIKGYILDAKIEPQTPRHIEQKRVILEERLLPWCEEHGAMDLAEVTPIILKGYVVHMQESTISETDSRISFRGRRLSPATIRDYLRIVRAFFTWCERESYLEGRANPMHSVPRTKLPQRIIHAFTPEQMDALLGVCDLDTASGFRNYTVLLVFMDTGIRVSELCSLRLAGIHDDYLTVIGKFDKEREVGLSNYLKRRR